MPDDNDSATGLSRRRLLQAAGIVPNSKVKQPRSMINSVKREQIVSDLMEGTLSTKEISVKHGITVDSVYNIKGKAKLTSPKKKTDPTPSVTTPTTPPSDETGEEEAAA